MQALNCGTSHCLGVVIWLASVMLSTQDGQANQSDKVVQKFENPVRITAAVDKAVASSDEEITLTIRLLTSESFAGLQIPEIADQFAGFRLVDFGVQEAKLDEQGAVVRGRWYRLNADLSGSYVLPAVKVDYQLQGETRQVSTAEIFIEITPPPGADQTADLEQAKDIRDIKALLKSPPALAWMLWLGAALALLTTSGAVFYFWRKRARHQQVALKPAHEVALAGLAALQNSALLQEGKVKKFHFDLSGIVRTYVEQRFGFPATDRTMEEIKRDIGVVGELAKAQQESFVTILSSIEVVKFTDFVPGRDASLHVLKISTDFVSSTQPVETVQESVI